MVSHGASISGIYHILRKLAKTNKYQTLYAQSKEGCVNLFKNISDYTDLQVAFLQYLSFYASLNLDIYLDEIDKIILEDEIYEDAYQTYKNKNKKNQPKQKLETPQEKQRRRKQKETTINNTHVLFSRPRIKSKGKK